MKIKRKGKKVHPSPPQATPPPPSPPATHDSLSVLKLLPAAIFALVAALSFQDREVLAYMITRSLKTTTTSSVNSSSPSVVQDQEELKLKLKKTFFHKPPVFDCECFECYTSFWFRWDSSANREVIHQAIEAFEEHLASGELEMKRNRRGKKKDKLPLPVQVIEIEPRHTITEKEETVPDQVDIRLVEVTPMVEEEAESAVVMAAGTVGHKGFARKVLPDVLGVFNSRLWNLWGPNV